MVDADYVVLSLGVRPENKLYDDINGKLKNVYLIGDAEKQAELQMQPLRRMSFAKIFNQKHIVIKLTKKREAVKSLFFFFLTKFIFDVFFMLINKTIYCIINIKLEQFGFYIVFDIILLLFGGNIYESTVY